MVRARHPAPDLALDFPGAMGSHRPVAAPSPAPDRRTQARRLAFTAVTFYLGARLGLLLVVPGTNVGIFWPPAGLALGLTLLWGPRVWPGIAVGALAALLPEQLHDHGPLLGGAVALGEAAADVVPTLLAAAWVRRALAGADPLARPPDLLKLVLLGGVLAQALAAAMGLAVIRSSDDLPGSILPSVAVNWWLSNAVSVCVFTTLVLAWRPPWGLARWRRHLLVYASTAVVGALAFVLLDASLQVYLRYLTIFSVILGAFVLGARGASAAAAILSGLAIWAVASGHEQVALVSVDRQLLMLNFYLATLSLTGLILAAVLEERRRAEAQREELREQLARAQRMESVGRLAGGVAHDLNNMLAPILALTDLMLRDAPAGTSQAEDLADVKRAAERARDLTRQLLAFGRKQVLALREVDLRELLAELERLLRRTIREDVRIDLRLPPRLGLVRADPGHLEQVIMNLAVNAQQAMPQGGQLTIEAADATLAAGQARGVPAGDWVALSVSDTGAGMAAEVLERVFEPFYTTKREGEGTGLGLAIVHGVVSQHGGHVVAESQPGRGATFRIYLPQVPAGRPALTPAPAAALPPRPGATVLVAEDEDVVRHAVVRLLERMGCRVLEARDAAACRRLAAEAGGAIDLLVTDVVMPDMNGRRLHQLLEEVQPGLKVLFMSGYAGDVLSQRGVLEDGLEYLQKPFTLEALEAAVWRALARRHLSRPAGPPAPRTPPAPTPR